MRQNIKGGFYYEYKIKEYITFNGVSMALHSIGVYHFPREDEIDTFEYVDTVLDIQGVITVLEDLELVLFVMGKTAECPSDTVIKTLDADIIKPKAEFLVSGNEDGNDLL